MSAAIRTATRDDNLRDDNLPMKDTMSRKMIHDAAAYIRGLAQMRGRNAEWAERAVREAVSLSAAEALNLKVIDYVATDVPDLLKQVNGRRMNVLGRDLTLDTASATVEMVEPDWRMRALAIITNPERGIRTDACWHLWIVLRIFQSRLCVTGGSGRHLPAACHVCVPVAAGELCRPCPDPARHRLHGGGSLSCQASGHSGSAGLLLSLPVP